MTHTVSTLPLVSDAEHQRILTAPRTAEAHRALLADLPAMNLLQTGGEALETILPSEISVVAWNLERCLFPAESASHLGPFAPQVILLSEMDHGMARTAQRHTTEDMAEALGMTYAFGVEFHELDLGGPTERTYCADDFNARGWHGNAILSSVPFDQLMMLRLDEDGHWFMTEGGAGDPEQPRVGGRMALAAILPGQGGPICVVSTHLESNSGARHRAAQFDALLNMVDQFAPDMPVIIGGDLNTGNHIPPEFDWRAETLFKNAENRGYDWSCSPEGMTTRPSLITPHPTRQMRLDWFCTRGFSCLDKKKVSSLTEEGKPLSDHDAVWCRIARS